jgi:aryl-alcohol dehydrogenase-like predicted oxidoreductase
MNQWSSLLSPRKPGQPAAVVVGTMNFGKRTPAPEAERIIHAALERGLRWFDTANVYTGGESERILGRALKGRREKALIATKVGVGTLAGPPEGLSPARIAAAVDESLQRLDVDRIDVYYLHTPDPKTPIDQTLQAIRALISVGKIGQWAVSNYAAWQLVDIEHRCKPLGLPAPAISQVLYNLLLRQLDVEYFACARRLGIHTTCYNALAGGLLAGRGLDRQIEPGSRFDGNPMYQKRYLSDRFFELVRAYHALAKDAGLTPVQLAYGWLSQRAGVDSVLIGPATLQQLEDAIEGCARKLPDEVVAGVEAIHRAHVGSEATYAR